MQNSKLFFAKYSIPMVAHIKCQQDHILVHMANVYTKGQYQGIPESQVLDKTVHHFNRNMQY